MIFLCYRRDDSGGFAGRLEDHLVRAFSRETVFRDINTIPPGVDFRDHIRNTLRCVDVVLVVIGRSWLDLRDDAGIRRLDNPDDLVRLEIATALNSGVRVVPVLVDRASPPKAQQLPDDIARLAHLNAFELSDARWDHDVARLASAIKGTPRENERPPDLAQPMPLGSVQASGVTFTGGEWERPYAEALLRADTVLDVEAALVPNIASGATPGMWIHATNREPGPLRGAAFVLHDVLLWHERSNRYIETEDVHQNGAFRPLNLEPRSDLFCDKTTELGFVRADDHSFLRIVGHRDGGQDDCRLKTPGVWQLRGEVVAGERRRAVELCFEWNGKLPPSPRPCPSTGSRT